MNYPRILVLDNYDSFTYNIVHYLEKLDVDVTVIKNDEIKVEEVDQFDKLIISPGPKLPADAGKTNEIILKYYDKKPILGICLGMQALGEFFGGTLYNQKAVKHGVQEVIHTLDSKIYKQVPSDIKVGLYHSWAVDISRAKELIPTAFSEGNVLMSMEHKQYPIVGVQFHPESIMTEFGMKIIENFIESY